MAMAMMVMMMMHQRLAVRVELMGRLGEVGVVLVE
jgi:hypothetical protein